MSYVVSGTAKVAGKSLGDQLTDKELDGANIPALIEGGHILPEQSPKKKSAASSDADTRSN